MSEWRDMQAIVKAIIETQVIKALNEAPEAIEKLVKAALADPVDASGDPKGYGTKIPYLDYLVGQEIRAATRVAVQKIIKERSDKIEAAVRTGLNDESIVTAMVKAFGRAADQDWRIRVNFESEGRI